jgi:hypothetical protein
MTSNSRLVSLFFENPHSLDYRSRDCEKKKEENKMAGVMGHTSVNSTSSHPLRTTFSSPFLYAAFFKNANNTSFGDFSGCIKKGAKISTTARPPNFDGKQLQTKSLPPPPPKPLKFTQKALAPPSEPSKLTGRMPAEKSAPPSNLEYEYKSDEGRALQKKPNGKPPDPPTKKKELSVLASIFKQEQCFNSVRRTHRHLSSIQH